MTTVFTNLRRAAGIGAAAVMAAGLTACSSGAGDTGGGAGSAEDPGIDIVTSTSVWGDVARAVTDDDAVTVTPVITGDDIDPHHFEPTAADMAKAEKADIVVVGGGGYDAWLYGPLAGHDDGGPEIVHPLPLVAHHHHHGEEGHEHGDEHAHEHGDEHSHGEADAAGEHHDVGNDEAHDGADVTSPDHEHPGVDPEGNEHVWYDPAAVAEVAEKVAAAIHERDSEIDVDPDAVTAKVSGLDEKLHNMPGVRVAQTEPIADHLLKHTHAREVTPAGYRSATLKESDPSAADAAEFLRLIENHGLDLLVYNPQTATDLTERLRAAAEKAGVRIVEIPETPPTDVDYLDHLDATVDHLVDAAAAAGSESQTQR